MSNSNIKIQHFRVNLRYDGHLFFAVHFISDVLMSRAKEGDLFSDWRKADQTLSQWLSNSMNELDKIQLMGEMTIPVNRAESRLEPRRNQCSWKINC